VVGTRYLVWHAACNSSRQSLRAGDGFRRRRREGNHPVFFWAVVVLLVNRFDPDRAGRGSELARLRAALARVALRLQDTSNPGA